MNIFILDKDPRTAAKYHCDKHINKMILESLQVLGSTFWFLHGVTQKKQISEEHLRHWKHFPRQVESTSMYISSMNHPSEIPGKNNLKWICKPHPYGIGFMNHPSTQWTRNSVANWEWLCELTQGLIDEYQIRYGRQSSVQGILNWFRKNTPVNLITNKELTNFYLAMPESIKTDDAVHSYRLYYAGWKEYFAKWKTQEPEWWRSYLEIVKENKETFGLHEKVVKRIDSNLFGTLK